MERNKFFRLNVYEKLLDKYGKGGKLLDIATGHGKFATLAALKGYKVTAFDARPDRIPFYLPNINWQVVNLKDFEFTGYDIINCLGIHYHLPLNEQFDLLGKINYTTVILDTFHVTDAVLKREKPITIDGYSGVERIEGTDLKSLKTKVKNAYDDLKNFCHTKESLLRLFNDFGFNVVEEAPGMVDDRNYYVLIPKN